MPTLDWIGKDKVINHHQEVPFRILERTYSYDEKGWHKENNQSENMIIHGDNLEALKALLPKYEGKIKCIYIDPPYNTGNEGWIYNDNVNDPKIKKWLGEVVGKEGEDLSRHDKWLCMMYPRLQLLQKLLAEDGAIFVSIDDIEYANLKLLCDEIFGSNCFVSNISWQRTYSPRNDSKGIVNEVEHLLVYSKTSDWIPSKLPRTLEMNERYKNPDNDIKPWKSSDAFAPDAIGHQGMVYGVQHPITGKILYPPNGRHWSFGQEQVLEIMQGWAPYELRDIDDAEMRAILCGIDRERVRQDVKAVMLAVPLEDGARQAEKVYQRGQWPIFCFSNNGNGGIRRKTYLDDVGGKLPTNYWPFVETGHTDEAKKEMLTIFNGKTTFDTPKPCRLVERILQIATNKNDVILDSFAGSGTTAHAVLNMNKADGGQRKFILIEMMEYADTISAERVKRVIDGYGDDKKKTEGTGGSFSYYELGERLLLENGNLNPDVEDSKIREYIWYMETRQNYVPVASENGYYLGTDKGNAYYFYYEESAACTLNYAFLATIKEKAENYVIYADRCALSEKDLMKHGIIFKKIPRDIPK